MEINNEKYIGIAEAAKILDLHPNSIRNLIKTGKLPYYRMGTRLIRIKFSDLQNVFVKGN